MRTDPPSNSPAFVRAVRNHWRRICLVMLAMAGAGGYFGYRKVHAILNPAVPKAMVLNMEVPDLSLIHI